jgi:hypothetical protein
MSCASSPFLPSDKQNPETTKHFGISNINKV